MASEKTLRFILFVAVAALHIVFILFFAFNVKASIQSAEENARVMKLVDLEEEQPPPPPPPPEPEQVPQVEAIAENMIETDIPPEQTIVAPGTLTAQLDPWDDYLPQFRLSVPPKFNEREIAASLVYPPIARRSGIEGRVILELFVDRNGKVQQVLILQETPQGRGFGDAAVKAFTGLSCAPAQANGEAVSCRYRYPVRFALK